MAGLGPGSELGHYRILRSLGSGGMADVYEAEDTRLGRHVALKILPPEFARNPQLIARFEKEVRAAASLNHRNIVTVFEVGEQGGLHYFSMRLLTGGDLRRRIERGLTPVESLAILRELADAFSHAHARGFVHRDVKPENVMFDEQGFPVLTDFGIAKALDTETRMTRTGMTMGTPRYLSPEQASGKPVDARADLYSLGVIFYEMLTGHPPYDAEESMAVIFKHVTEPVPQLPGDLVRLQPLLEKLMAKDADQRIASAEDLIRAIDAIAPRAGGHEPPPSQVRTQENPLIANLLTPSPLRTAPPVTPRPVVTAPPIAAGDTGEVAVKTAAATTRASPAARRAAAAPPPAVAPAESSPAPAAPGRVPALAAGSMVVAVAAVGLAAWAYRHEIAALVQPAPAPVQAPVTAIPVEPPAAPAEDPAARRRAQAEALKLEQARQAKLRQDAEARKKAEAEAALKRQQEQARQDQIRREQAAAQKRAADEAAAKQRAEAQAEAKRRAEAEAAEKRRLEQAAREKQRQEAEAKKEADAAAARRKKEEEARTAAARRKKEAEAKAAAPTEEQKKAEEEEARERARRPAGF